MNLPNPALKFASSGRWDATTLCVMMSYEHTTK
jgi:hypothetical protein